MSKNNPVGAILTAVAILIGFFGLLWVVGEMTGDTSLIDEYIDWGKTLLIALAVIFGALLLAGAGYLFYKIGDHFEWW